VTETDYKIGGESKKGIKIPLLGGQKTQKAIISQDARRANPKKKGEKKESDEGLGEKDG